MRVTKLIKANVEVQLGVVGTDTSVNAWRNRSVVTWDNPESRYVHPDVQIGQFIQFDGRTYQVNEEQEKGIGVYREASPIGFCVLLQRF